VLEDGWYARNDVELLLDRRATSIDAASRTVHLDRSERVGYDRLLLATGSAVRRLPIPGAELDGVLYLRTVGDSNAIRAAIATGAPMVVIGGGWIGVEVTAVARSAGVPVTLVTPEPAPMTRALGQEVGLRVAGVHRKHGVTVLTGKQVRRLLADGTRVRGVELDDGSTVEAGVVVVGIGAQPRTELAESAGLTCGDGVPVDVTLRTEDPRIWAAGDIALAQNTWVGGPVRVEHFANAENQGTFVGRSMAGAHETWGTAPFFWSDQYDDGMEYRGYVDPKDSRLVFRDVQDGQWAAFWLVDDRISAGMHWNLWSDAQLVRDLVLDRAVVDVARLADPAVPLGATRAG
jgi:3-phenylpropionate/trans-cinnamate dioxygenase ferredoxin reductase subunit